MPVFEYKGFNAKGKKCSGVIDGDGPRYIRTQLKKDGIFITDLKISDDNTAIVKAGGKALSKIKRKRKMPFSSITERVTTEEISLITRQLATLIGAGITLVESLTALVDQVEKEKVKVALSQIKQQVNEGSSLADAMNNHPKIFSPLYTNMIRAGESSGALEVVLNRLADLTEAQAKLRSKVSSAMVYPVVMIAFSIIIIGVLFVVVIPKVTKIFEDIEATLPLPTQILIALSEFAQNYWWGIMIVMVGGGYLFSNYIKSEKGKPK